MRSSKKYYFCSKYGCIWSDEVANMIEGYEYPPLYTWYFDSEEEADAKVVFLQLEEEAAFNYQFNYEWQQTDNY